MDLKDIISIKAISNERYGEFLEKHAITEPGEFAKLYYSKLFANYGGHYQIVGVGAAGYSLKKIEDISNSPVYNGEILSADASVSFPLIRIKEDSLDSMWFLVKPTNVVFSAGIMGTQEYHLIRAEEIRKSDS